MLFHSGDLDKAMGKLRDVAGDLSPATLDKLQAVVDILKKTSFYHSTTVSRTQHVRCQHRSACTSARSRRGSSPSDGRAVASSDPCSIEGRYDTATSRCIPCL